MAWPEMGRNITHADAWDAAMAAATAPNPPPASKWCRIYFQGQTFTTGSPWSQIWQRNALGEKVICSTYKVGTMSDVINGVYDTYYRNIANGIVANATQQVIYVYIHEPENPNPKPNGKIPEGPAAYKAAATHLYRDIFNPVFHAAPLHHRTAVALMGYTADSASGRDGSLWITPECDIVLFDTYSTLGASDSSDPAVCMGNETAKYLTGEWMFNQCRDLANRVGKPHGHAEMGMARRQSDVPPSPKQTAAWKQIADGKSFAIAGNEMGCIFEMGCQDNMIEENTRDKAPVLREIARIFTSGTLPPPPTALVPNVVGLSAAAAIVAIEAVGLVASGPATGTVDAQAPVAGTQVATGSTVTYTCNVPVPPPAFIGAVPPMTRVKTAGA